MEIRNLRRFILVWAGLLVILLLSGCTRIKAEKLVDPTQLKPSQDTTEVRTTKPYVLDVGDEVSIKVWGFDDLSKTATINNSGDIFYPMLGNIHLAGKTVPQAQEILATRLKKYLVDPQIEFTSSTSRQVVYILGEVTSPGVQNFRRPLTMLEAMARAGWFSQSGNKSNVILVRRAENNYQVFRVNFSDLLKDDHKLPQVYLQSGDLIYVPPTKIVDLARFMNNINTILQPFMTAEQMVVLWPSFKNAIQGRGVGLSISSGGGSSSPASTSSTTSSTTTTTSSTAQ